MRSRALLSWGYYGGLGLGACLVGMLVAAPVQAGEPSVAREAEARGFGPGELRPSAQIESSMLSSQRAERRGLTLHGLPVRGGFETTWFGPQSTTNHGPGRVVAARYPSAPPQLLPAQARLSAAEARRVLLPTLRPDQRERIRAGSLGPELEALGGELVYLLILDRPVLAWELSAPLSSGSASDPGPTRERVWVSAATGRILLREEQVFAINEADVYRINPQHTPLPEHVTLTNIEVDEAPWEEGMSFDAQYLNGSRVRIFNCIDEEAGPFAPWHNDGECFPTQTVAADAEGDFIVSLPDVALSADNLDPSDPYAEVSMYFHAETFFEFMAMMGVEEFPCERSNMVANFHWLEPAPDFPTLSYGPYNNAYYSGQCDIEKGPTMLFGQGSAVDFAFDGDVIYHELGHGIVGLLTPDGLHSYTTRPEGVLRDARALNEAIADYHTIMITQRPELADYVGFYWPELDRAWIRNAENEQLCPRDMAGQEHNDSEPFSAALWIARERIGGDKLDPVMLGILPLLSGDATLEQASAALMEVAEAERDAGIWTSEDLDQLAGALRERGVDDCERVVDTELLIDEDPRFLYLRGNSDAVAPYWPGPVQYRHAVPAGSDNLLLTFEATGKGNSAGQPVTLDLDPVLLVKRSSVSADAPITFEYSLSSVGSADREGDDVDEITLVEGDWDAVYLPTQLTPRRRQVLIRGLEAGEVVHVAFANPEREIVVIKELLFASVPTEELDGGSPGGDQEEMSTRLDDGCACASGGRGDNGGLLGFALLSLLGLGRRATRRQPRPE